MERGGGLADQNFSLIEGLVKNISCETSLSIKMALVDCSQRWLVYKGTRSKAPNRRLIMRDVFAKNIGTVDETVNSKLTDSDEAMRGSPI